MSGEVGVIMFDEIDGLLRKRGGGGNSDRDNAELVRTFNSYSDAMMKDSKHVAVVNVISTYRVDSVA